VSALVPYEPDRLLEVFERHRVRYVVIGGFAAVLRGSPYDTTNVDITPERSELNLRRLSAALDELQAAVRGDAESTADLLALELDLATLDRFHTLALTTEHGNLDLCPVPDGTQGYPDLRRGATRELITETLEIPLASLADVIRSKEAAGREKDLLHLPTLRRVLERARQRPP